MPAIGIDLGTTNSCVAVWQNDRIQIIPNNQGKRTTPSYVAFTDNECLVGAPAKNQASKNSLNTIFDAKRLIGRNYNDPDIQSDIKQWPFKVINVDGKPKIKIQLNDKEEEYEPEKISSLILIKMKEIAETFLGEPVKDAVITVPAYFNDSQRKATRDAGKLAGLNVLRIINEPTAAALAYGIDKELTGKKNVLVYDIGGGTTDVSILTITDGSKFEVKSTSGDTHLGGEDFDSKLVDHFCEEFYRKNKINIKDKSRSLRRLRAAAVNAKQDLSSSGEALIEIDSLCDGIDFTTTITKTEFERVCNDLFVAALKPVDDAINGAKINKMLIDDILLVGGTTRIPKIQALLQNYFCGKPLNFTINPDEAVAFGAAIQAEMLVNNEYKSSRIKNMKLIDVTGHSLGVGTGEHTMMFFIPRNKKIPCKKTQLMQTFLDNQTDVIFPIYEGEDDDIRNNRLLGEFELNGIPPAKAGTEILQVTFNLDADGILHVTAINKKTGLSNEIKINRDKGNLSSEEFKKRLSEIEKFKIKEKLQQEAAAERYKIETYILSLINTIEDSSCKLSLEKKNQVLEICSDANCWLKRNRGEDKVIYISKMEEVTGLCTLIMASE